MALTRARRMTAPRTYLRQTVFATSFHENSLKMAQEGSTRWEGRSGQENKRKICFAIASIIFLCTIDETSSRAIADEESKITTKRSPKPLGIGYVSFDIPIHQRSPIEYNASPPLLEDLPHLPITIIPHQQSAIKPDTIVQRGPSVSHGTVINLVEHELIQPEHPKEHGHVIVDITEVSHHPIHEIVPLLPTTVSNTRKTSITTKVGHVVTPDDKQIPVLTHSVSHTSEEISHHVVTNQGTHIIPVTNTVHTIKYNDIDLHVIPLHSPPDNGLPRMKPVVVSWAAESRPNPNSIIVSHEAVTRDESAEDRDRRPVGGYGVGISFGGQGAGHGYWAGK